MYNPHKRDGLERFLQKTVQNKITQCYLNKDIHARNLKHNSRGAKPVKDSGNNNQVAYQEKAPLASRELTIIPS